MVTEMGFVVVYFFLHQLRGEQFMKNYELQLPEGYVEAKTIDAKTDTKIMVVFSVVSALVAVGAVVVAWLCLGLTSNNWIDKLIGDGSNLWHNFAFMGAMVAYIILHELTHGIVYKVMTKQKLTFGLTLTVAYCGVPNIYVYRKTALCALLAPFLVFLPIFTALPFFMKEPIDILWCALLWGMHVGGCVGDLYCTILYLFKFRDPRTLLRDTGPKQTFYIPTEQTLQA